MTITKLKHHKALTDFIFKHECKCYCDAYVTALKILGEKPKEQWTPNDVIEAVLRASQPGKEQT